MATNKNLIKAWINAFNTKNIEAIIELYEDGGIHFSSAYAETHGKNGILKTKRDMETWWTEVFKQYPKLHYALIETETEKNGVRVEYLRSSRDGKSIRRVEELFRVSKGKILYSEGID